MKPVFEKIWEAALPYQDKRNDDGHARVTLKFAKELLKREGGNEDVVIPAIILHDTGYSQIPEKRRMLIFDPDATPEERREVRYEHQDESVKLATEILNRLDYPHELVPEILEIISQHDTRKGFISKEEGLVRDADKLWRFSEEGFAADVRRNQSDIDNRVKRLENDLLDADYIFSRSAGEIARKELEDRRKENRI